MTNLGFGGSCHLDQFAARHIRDLPADVISLKLGINVSNQASLIDRTFVAAFHGFVDTIRDGHPDTPIVVASPIICPSAEDRPGPSENVDGKFRAAGDPAAIERGALTLQRIRTLLAEGVTHRRDAGDTSIHYLDGLELFGPDDVAALPADLHPNGDGYERIAQHFAELVFGATGLVGSGTRDP
jgi:hypothetical protein